MTTKDEALRAENERLREALEDVREWIKSLPIPTTGATGALMKVHAALNEGGEDA